MASQPPHDASEQPGRLRRRRAPGAPVGSADAVVIGLGSRIGAARRPRSCPVGLPLLTRAGRASAYRPARRGLADPVGYANSDVGCELPVRAGRAVGSVALQPPHRKVTLMLSKLAYLTRCRSTQVLMLLTRGDAAKDLEILVLRHQPTVLGHHTHVPGWSPPTGPCSPPSAARWLPRERWSCLLVQPDTLLGWHRRLVAGAGSPRTTRRGGRR